MKKIISGKTYNTDTATEIYVYDNGGHPTRDFHALVETLYRTPKGAWFIHGDGGANTIYCTDTGHHRMAGEDIRLISAQEAQAWLENQNAINTLEKHFTITPG